MERNEYIIEKLRERGCKITKQRKILLDIILNEECSCCKEIYYKAFHKNQKIGMSTVYRMVNMLEEIGAIGRHDAYKISGFNRESAGCIVKLEDNSKVKISVSEWNQIVRCGLEVCGYTHGQKVKEIVSL